MIRIKEDEKVDYNVSESINSVVVNSKGKE